MKQILVIYHSQTGNTKKMAQAVARGAGLIEGVDGNQEYFLLTRRNA